VVPALISVPVELLSPLDHGLGDIEAVDLVKVSAQGLGQTADAAPEVETSTAADRQAAAVQILEQTSDLFFTGAEEFFGIPAVVSFVRLAENGPERILPTQRVPRPAQVLDRHRASLGDAGPSSGVRARYT